MEYNSLIHCIPTRWKKGINIHARHAKTDDVYLYCQDRVAKLDEMHCKQFTNIFLLDHVQTPAAQEKWQKYLNVTDINWKYIYQIPYIVCRDTEIQSLQYKIINRFFPCNYAVSKWYVEASDKCNHCQNTDFLEHFFYLCPSLGVFWSSLSKWWLNNLQCTFKLKPEEVIFGICNENEDNVMDIINYCILMAKYYIAQSRKKELEPNLYEYLRFIKSKLDIDLVYSRMENQEQTFVTNWSLLHDSL